MYRPITYEKQTVRRTDDAQLFNNLFEGGIGICKGCEITHSESAIFISRGFFIVSGRWTMVDATVSISVPATITGVLYCRLVFDIDLARENTETVANQARFAVLTDPDGWPALVQEDLDANPQTGRYQQLWADFMLGVNGIYDLYVKVKRASLWGG